MQAAAYSFPNVPTPEYDWEGMGKFGEVRAWRGGWRIYIYPHPQKYLYNAAGTPFESEKHVRAVAGAIVAAKAHKGTTYQQAIEPWLPPASKRLRVDRKAAEWLRFKRAQRDVGKISHRYVAELERWVEHPEPAYRHFSYWEGRSCHEITKAELASFEVWLLGRVGASTAAKVLGGFRQLAGWLHDDRVIAEVPPFPEVDAPEYLPSPVDVAVQDRLLGAIPEPYRGIFYALCLGVRPSEARGLIVACYRAGWLRIDRACDGQGVEAPVRLRTKTGRIREIPCDARLSAAIEATLPRDPGARLFTFDGHPWSHATLSDYSRRACEAVGVQVPLYEWTKHTFATDRLNDPAVRESDVQAFLGHADVRSTRRYGKLRPSALVRTLRRETP